MLLERRDGNSSVVNGNRPRNSQRLFVTSNVRRSEADNEESEAVGRLSGPLGRPQKAFHVDGVSEPYALHLEGENTTVHLFSLPTRYIDEHLGGHDAAYSTH